MHLRTGFHTCTILPRRGAVFQSGQETPDPTRFSEAGGGCGMNRTGYPGSRRSVGYTPDKQEKATRWVVEQAAVLCRDWAGNGDGLPALLFPCLTVE